MAQKILLEIEYSKTHTSELQKNQKDVETNKTLIDQQRLVIQLEKQSQQIIEINNILHTPTVTLRNSVATVNNTRIQNIFCRYFNFTSARMDDCLTILSSTYYHA